MTGPAPGAVDGPAPGAVDGPAPGAVDGPAPGPLDAMASGPLDGVIVADFSRVLAGPLATMTLGDLGADVIKVERPGTGDDTRTWAPPRAPGGEASYFLSVNRNKRGITLDLSTPDGRGTARRLAERADVLVENFATGTMERFGLGYDDLARCNPRLVYASITGFGRDSTLPGYDFLVQAVGGLMSITGTPEGDPVKVGVALVDVLAGQCLTAGILAALYARQRTGQGQRVEVDLLSSLLSGLVNQASAYLNAGVVPGRLGNAHPSIAPYQALRTQDRPIVVAVGNDRQFGRLYAALAAVDPTAAGLGQDLRFRDNPSRVRHRDPLAAALEAVLVRRSAAYWVEALTAAGVPCGPVNTIAEAFALADLLGLAPVVTGAGVRTVASPIRLSGTPASYRRRPPRLGEHSAEIDAWLAASTTAASTTARRTAAGSSTADGGEVARPPDRATSPVPPAP